MPWAIALIAIGGIVGMIFWLARASSTPNNPETHSYGANLVLSNVHLEYGSNFTGDPLLFIQGTVENRGNRTVTSIDVQAFFTEDTGNPPRMEEAPVAVIRSRQPYMNTAPLSSTPLAPGKTAEFQLTFDHVPPFWNKKLPKLKILQVETQP